VLPDLQKYGMNMAGMMWRQKNDPPLFMALVPENDLETP